MALSRIYWGSSPALASPVIDPPALSAVTAVEITGTTFRPKVTVTYPVIAGSINVSVAWVELGSSEINVSVAWVELGSSD